MDGEPKTPGKAPIIRARAKAKAAERARAAIAAASPWKTTAEAAAYLKRGRRFVIREIHAGRLRAARIGGRQEILTRTDWMDAWVDDQATPVMLHRRAG